MTNQTETTKPEACAEAGGQVERVVRPLAIAAALRAYQQGDPDGVAVLVSRQACDEGADWLERLNRETEARYRERELVCAKMDHAVLLLNGIHALLYPTPFTAKDGRTMVFRPKSLDPHEVLQELSDRIRALPDEMAKAGLAQPNAKVSRDEK